jgi:hypothetical protein
MYCVLKRPLSLFFVVIGLTLPCHFSILPSGEPAASKIQFSQETGCLNDDSFEFCIPAADPDALSAVLAIAPQAVCAQGSRGRAGCTSAELLCMVETSGDLCRADAMTDETWQMVQDLAALPFIQRIVPTWYE